MLLRDLPTFLNLGINFALSRIPYYPIIITFDVTNKCTLRCKHCYWWLQEHDSELDDDTFFNKVVELKKRHPSLIQAVWLGGEPLLRPKLIERCKTLFSLNRVITNGTLPLPLWKDVRFICSVDGTKEYHELQRGKNTYKKIKENINRSDLNINLFCVVTKLNYPCLEAYVDEWSKTKVRSVGFGFYTPIKGKNNDEFWLNFTERDKVIERIIQLKKQYPKFINSSLSLLNNFRSANCQVTTERCRRDYSAFNGMCFDAYLVRKFPCVIGENADCTKCGCVVSTLGELIRHGDKTVLLEQ